MVTKEAEKALEERDRELQKRHEQWCTNYCMNKCKARKDCSGQPNAECGEYMARMDEEIKFRNKKFYVPVHGANEVKELKDLASQVAFYKQELVKEKMYSWAKEHMIERHASSIDFSRDQMIEDLFGSYEMLNLMKVGITYADLLLATDELWAELEEARAAYQLKLAAEKVEPGEPLKPQGVAE